MKKVIFFYYSALVVFLGLIPWLAFIEAEVSIAFEYIKKDYLWLLAVFSLGFAYYFEEYIFRKIEIKSYFLKNVFLCIKIILGGFVVGLMNMMLCLGILLIINANFGEQRNIKVDVEILSAEPIKRKSGATVAYEIETAKIPELGRGLTIKIEKKQYHKIENWRYKEELKVGSLGIVYK